ncbi:MAG: MoaD/ThiS family protein [Planctomycetes bacterium]|nr:MoaD/ThiS family protein [Planctomycetota bacterium]
MATVQVELFGVPRQRAGQSVIEAQGSRLADVLSDLAIRFPALAECCIDGDRLRAGYVASLGGRQFVTDPQTPLTPGESVLILSADAGG